MKKLILVIAVLLVATGIIWYAINTAPVESEQLVVTGSATLAPLMQDIAERYQSLHPRAQIAIQANNSLQGVADVRQGTADIGLVSRDPSMQEKDLNWFMLAKDGIGVIVHKDNPITALTDKQIAAIFTGDITRWDAAGGNSAGITTVNAAEGNSSRTVFVKYFGIKAAELAQGPIIGYNEQIIKTVAGNPAAIGYASLGIAEQMAKQGTAIKLLPLESVTASMENVRRGRYPLTRTLNLVTRSAPQGLAKRFIDYTLSREAAALIKAHGFIPAAK